MCFLYIIIEIFREMLLRFKLEEKDKVNVLIKILVYD